MLDRPMYLALALSADSVAIDDFVTASTIYETERDATAEAARAFNEFWNTGDEAALKQALAENFADHAMRQGSEGANRSISARPARPPAVRTSSAGVHCGAAPWFGDE